MNQRSTRIQFTLFFGILALTLSACSGGLVAKRGRTNRTPANTVAAAPAVWRPSAHNDIPVAMNGDVKRWVGLFQGRFKPNFDRWIGRLGMYGPTVSRILKEEGVPQDLIYLAMIESGFNLNATSVAACVGPWQFSRGTGRMYGLNNDFFMDDRRDLVEATRAAARHLKDLYQTYGDWYLSFAAYNAGPGTVNRAIRGTGSNDYWTHARSRYLRQETKDYVPKILAALHIVKNYPQFGYTVHSFAAPMKYDRVTVPDATDVATLAKSAGTSVEVIQELNPKLTSGITRPGHETGVFLPLGTKELFQRRYASIPEDERVSGLYHKVGRRENLNTIAKHYGVNKTRIAKMNNISPNQAVSPGQVLRVPADKKSLLALASRAASGSGRGSWATHRVRRGETLASVAARYRTNVRNLASWNRMGAKTRLRIGQRLKVYQAPRENGGMGSFFASTPNFQSAAHVSGVTHIITQDQHTPADLAMTKQEASEILPKMTAVSDDAQITELDADRPSVIRTIDDVTSPAEEMNKQMAAALSPKPVHPAPVYTVKRGDTLGKIAALYHVPLSQIKQMNGLKSDALRVNQKLIVKKGAAASLPRYVTMAPTKTPSIVKSASAAPVVNKRRANATIVHQTRSGDTLWKISKRYGVKITDIKRWNQLRGDTLKPNQKIKILATGDKNVALVKS